MFKLRLSEWSKESQGNENIKTVTVNPAINQIADLLSAILLYTVSERFKRLHCKEERDNGLEDDLICSAICLLSNEPSLLKQLVKKWINVVKGIICFRIIVFRFFELDEFYRFYTKVSRESTSL